MNTQHYSIMNHLVLNLNLEYEIALQMLELFKIGEVLEKQILNMTRKDVLSELYKYNRLEERRKGNRLRDRQFISNQDLDLVRDYKPRY